MAEININKDNIYYQDLKKEEQNSAAVSQETEKASREIRNSSYNGAELTDEQYISFMDEAAEFGYDENSMAEQEEYEAYIKDNPEEAIVESPDMTDEQYMSMFGPHEEQDRKKNNKLPVNRETSSEREKSEDADRNSGEAFSAISDDKDSRSSLKEKADVFECGVPEGKSFSFKEYLKNFDKKKVIALGKEGIAKGISNNVGSIALGALGGSLLGAAVSMIPGIFPAGIASVFAGSASGLATGAALGLGTACVAKGTGSIKDLTLAKVKSSQLGEMYHNVTAKYQCNDEKDSFSHKLTGAMILGGIALAVNIPAAAFVFALYHFNDKIEKFIEGFTPAGIIDEEEKIAEKAGRKSEEKDKVNNKAKYSAEKIVDFSDFEKTKELILEAKVALKRTDAMIKEYKELVESIKETGDKLYAFKFNENPDSNQKAAFTQLQKDYESKLEQKGMYMAELNKNLHALTGIKLPKNLNIIDDRFQYSQALKSYATLEMSCLSLIAEVDRLDSIRPRTQGQIDYKDRLIDNLDTNNILKDIGNALDIYAGDLDDANSKAVKRHTEYEERMAELAKQKTEASPDGNTADLKAEVNPEKDKIKSEAEKTEPAPSGNNIHSSTKEELEYISTEVHLKEQQEEVKPAHKRGGHIPGESCEKCALLIKEQVEASDSNIFIDHQKNCNSIAEQLYKYKRFSKEEMTDALIKCGYAKNIVAKAIEKLSSHSKEILEKGTSERTYYVAKKEARGQGIEEYFS